VNVVSALRCSRLSSAKAYVPSQYQIDWSALAVTTTSRLNWVRRPVPASKTQIASTSLLQVQTPDVLPLAISLVATWALSAGPAS
jgi:hypothetical protein